MKSSSFHGIEVIVFTQSFRFQGIDVHPLADNFEDRLMAALEAAYTAGKLTGDAQPSAATNLSH